MASRPLVSILIVAWNRRADVLETLDGVLRLEYPLDRVEVLVLDNGSTDGTFGAVREWSLSPGAKALHRAEVFQVEANLGCSGGRNFLAARVSAGSDFLVLLDDDAVPEPTYLDAVVGVAGTDRRIGIVGAHIVDFATQASLAAAGSIHWRLVRFTEAHPRVTAECDFVSGCALFVRRAAFDAVSGFDEEYLAYHEDVDFCVRVRRRGYRVMYEPSARVHHKVPPGKRRTPDRLYYLFRNKLLFMHKHAALRRHALAWLLYAIAWPPALILQSLAVNRRVDLAEIATILRAVRDGLRGRRGRRPA